MEEKYKFVGDLTNMIKRVADDQSADVAIMTSFKIGCVYEGTLHEMRANNKATQLSLKTDKNPRKCPILKAYGTPRHPREANAKRSKSVGGVLNHEY